MQVNEEAWNAYPMTRTRYSSPIMDRFSIEIDTLYFNDAGIQDNVFNLSETELKQRVVGSSNPFIHSFIINLQMLLILFKSPTGMITVKKKIQNFIEVKKQEEVP